MSLPILSSSFFDKHRPQKAVLAKWQSAAKWSAHFMPIYEWDDVLFVGCSQPPSEEVISQQKVVYVFCEAQVLNRLWEDFHDTSAETDAPEGFDAKTVVLSAAPQSASFDDLGISPDSPEEATPEEPLSPVEALELGDAPSGLTEPSDNNLPMPPTPLVLEKITSLQDEKPVKEEVSESSIETETPAPEASAPVSEHTNTKTMSFLTSITSASATPEQVFKGVFKEMGRSFQKTMILFKRGEQAIPWKWDEQFEKANPQHKKMPIPLNIPSPFRIVYRTQKSYHGYIVPNDQNDKFFRDWNGGQSPDHLTLSPIIVDEVVVGMILGIGDKSADTKTTLLQTEHLAEAIAKKLKATPSLLAAA